MSGGGGNGTSQEILGNWSDPMNFYWDDPKYGFLPRARLESLKGYEKYDGERIAPMHGNQTTAIKNAGDVAISGTNLANAGRDQVLRTSNGDYLKNSAGQEYNPFDSGVVPIDRGPEAAGLYDKWAANNPAAQKQFVAGKYDAKQMTAADKYSANPQFVADKYNAKQLTVGKNDYAGMDSPYYQSLIGKGAKQITDAYKSGTAADTQKMFNMAGIFGGGANQQAVEKNEKNLGETLDNYVAGMGNAQYDRSANLAESDIGRKLGAQQFDVGTDAQAYGDWANRKGAGSQFDIGTDANAYGDWAARQGNAQQFNIGTDANAYGDWASRAGAASAGDIGRSSDYFDRYVNRDTGAQQFNRGTDTGLWNSERGRQAGAGQFGSGNDKAAMDIYKDLYGFGEKAQGQQQRGLDQGYQDWQDKQGWGKNQLNWYGNALSQAQGTTGSQQVNNYGGGGGINPFAGAMAGGLFGRSMGWF